MTIPPPARDRESPGSLAEERWKAVFDNPRIGVTITGPDGRFLETNERFQSLVGYFGEELRHMTVIQITHPDDLATHLRAADAIRSGSSRSVHLDKRYLRKGGGVVWVRVTAFMVPERDGAPGEAIALVEDVTERRAIVERLKQQERQTLDAETVAHFGTWEWDPVSDVAVWSDGLYRLLGVDPIRIRPSLASYLERVFPEDLPLVRSSIESAFQGRTNIDFDNRIVRPDGDIRTLRNVGALTFDQSGAITRVIGVTQDITERKAAEERLEKQDRLFREAQRIAHFGTWDWDPVADTSEWSAEMHHIFQTDATTFRPNYRTFMEYVAPEDREAVRSTIEAAVASGSNVEYDTRIVTPDDRRLTIRTFGSPVFDENGVMTRVVGVTQDITAQRRAEERLRESDARYRLLFEINPSPMWVYDVETFAFLAVNEAAVRHYGYSRNEFLSMKMTEIRPPEDVPKWLEHFQSRPNLYTGGVWRHRKKDGTEVFVESMARSVDFAGRPARLVLVRDVTDRRRAEERLARSAREMRALSARLQSIREEEDSRVAREVHDGIGQALTALGLDVAWLARNLNRKEGRAKFAEKLRSMSALIETTTGTVERIASDLRPGILDELGLEAAAEWAVREFGERTGMACRFESQLQRNPTDLDRGTAIFRILQEALTNVARHARARRVEVRLWDDAAGLHLEVRDDGAGIDTGRIADSRSFGLLGMRERSRAFDGNCVITPHPDGGTLVSATLPDGAVTRRVDHRNGGKSDAPHSRRR